MSRHSSKLTVLILSMVVLTTTPSFPYVATHQLNCKYTGETAAVDSSDPTAKPFACTKCTSRFKTKNELNSHVKRVHEWKPHGCNKPGCDPTIIFENKSQAKKHGRDYHSAFKATKCTFPKCRSSKVFKNYQDYRSHLTHSHRLSTNELREYYPKIERLKEMAFVPWKCGVEGCREHTVFAKRGNLKEAH